MRIGTGEGIGGSWVIETVLMAASTKFPGSRARLLDPHFPVEKCLKDTESVLLGSLTLEGSFFPDAREFKKRRWQDCGLLGSIRVRESLVQLDGQEEK